MKIGELSERTGIPTRMLRYYEQQGLITPTRSANGYRSYGDDDVATAAKVRSLVQSGLSTRIVKVVLDAERARADAAPRCSIELARLLADELLALESRISCLSQSRDAVREYLQRTKPEALLG